MQNYTTKTMNIPFLDNLSFLPVRLVALITEIQRDKKQ